MRRHGRPVDPAVHEPLDAVLISHAHRDHLDLPSLRRLDRRARLIVAPGLASIVGKLGFAEVVELAPGQGTRIGELTVTATHAAHARGRGPFGSGTETVGFLVEGQGRRVYFAGDTDLFGLMSELAPLDLALLPVWGWGPRLSRGHLDPKRAAQALELLRPGVAVPIHWGTLYPLGRRGLRSLALHEPPRLFAQHAARETPEVEVRIVEPGGSTEL